MFTQCLKNVFINRIYNKNNFNPIERRIDDDNVMRGWLFNILIIIFYSILSFTWSKSFVSGEDFILGYLTGSQRRPGDLEYTRPGKLTLH